MKKIYTETYYDIQLKKKTWKLLAITAFAAETIILIALIILFVFG